MTKLVKINKSYCKISSFTYICKIKVDLILRETMNKDIIDSLAKASEYLKNEEIDKAMDLFESVIVEDSKNVEALLGCGRIWQKRGDFKNALNCYYKVLAVDADNTVAKTSIEMLNGIFSYYNKDLINP